MPSIVYIDRRVPSPNRRMPRNVSMTEILPAPHVCRKQRKLCKTYADGTIWCEHCMQNHHEADVIDRRRGRVISHVQPAWKVLPVD